jgi:hypothetical protein
MMADLKEVQTKLRDPANSEQPATRAAREILNGLDREIG